MVTRRVLLVSGRIAKAILLLVFMVLVSGWVYRVIKDSADRSDYPAPGQIYTVGEYKMHLHCMGAGAPTIILEQGLGHAAVAWRQIHLELSQTTRTCAYDRPGLGHSEASGHNIRADEVARNLRGLLETAEINGDLVLVGWSSGGVYIREFFQQNPGNVKGMVLIDSSHEQQSLRFAVIDGPSSEGGINWQLVLYKYGGMFGLVRLMDMHANAFAPIFDAMGTSPELRAEVLAQYDQIDSIRARVRESNSFELDIRSEKGPLRLGDLPLIVISRGLPDINSGTDEYGQKREAIHAEMQTELVSLSSNARQIIAEQSNHNVPFMQPDLVVASILEMLEHIRSERIDEQMQEQ